jgi:hypothetical protein
VAGLLQRLGPAVGHLWNFTVKTISSTKASTWGAVGIDAYEPGLRARPFDSRNAVIKIRTFQIVDHVKGDHRLKAVVRKRPVDRVAKMEAPDYLGPAFSKAYSESHRRTIQGGQTLSRSLTTKNP